MNMRYIFTWLGIFAFTSLPLSAMADIPPWPDAPYQYMARKTPVMRVLSDFAATFGLQMHAAEGIGGTLDGSYATAGPAKFLDGIAASNGFTWYYHGGTLYVSRTSDSIMRTLRVGNADMGVLSASLQKLGLLDSRFGWGAFAEHGSIVVSGPPTYVARIADTLEQLVHTSTAGQALRVFKLQHASVGDRTFSYRDQQVLIPGVATVLRRIIEGGGEAALSATTIGKALPPARALAGELTRMAEPEKNAETVAPSARSSVRPNFPAIIEPDFRTNSLVVRGDPALMPLYDAVIHELDIPNALIEIEAVIVDVSTDKESEFGIDWSLQSSKITAGIGSAATVSSPRTLTLGWSNTLHTFLSTVRALERTGDAELLARPSVLTFANQPAILDLSETFYIRVQGERVATAIPVSTGTMLRVTPRLVQGEGGYQVQLTVDIEAGQVQPTLVDGLPIVKKTTISTQALVGEKQSLLIGGYFFNSTTKQKDKVPGLGDIPLFGALFSTKNTSVQRRERMFMIVPRIIHPSMTSDPQAAAAVPSEDKAPATMLKLTDN